MRLSSRRTTWKITAGIFVELGVKGRAWPKDNSVDMYKVSPVGFHKACDFGGFIIFTIFWLGGKNVYTYS